MQMKTNTTPEISTFKFHNIELRTVLIDGVPWFVGQDVVNILLGTASGKGYIYKRLNDDEKAKVSRTILGMKPGRDTFIISESGLYKLVMRSDKAQAEEFQEWVTGTVLPSIRKDGGYIMGEEKVVTGEMSEDELLLKAMTILQGKVERLSKERDAYHAELAQVTVAEYAALNHVYFSHKEKVALALQAVAKAKAEMVTLSKSPRTIRRGGKSIDTAVNVYPRDILDRAAAELGLFKAVGAQPRILN
jgi:prophage antirepressor-like protein